MPNRSKSNTKRKRQATAKLERWREREPGKEQEHRDQKLDQKVSYGQPGNLGSGSQLGSAKEEAAEGDQ